MPAILCGIMLALMLRFPAAVLESALGGLHAFARSVLPTLFPYMVFCQLAGERLAGVQHINAAVPCLVLGLLGGSPSGARLCASLYGQGRISRRMLHALCAACGTVSPMFIYGTIGAWTGDARFALCALVCHFAGALLCALLTLPLLLHAPRPRAMRPAAENVHGHTTLPEAITQSAQAMLTVCGCITLFSVLAAMPGAVLPHLSSAWQAALHAVLEMAGGSHALLGLGLPAQMACTAVCACLSFGGLSLMMQNMAFLRPTGIRVQRLVLLRAAHAVLSAALCYFAYPYIGV